MGFKLVLVPVSLLFAVTYTMRNMLEALKQGVDAAAFNEGKVSFSTFTTLIGLPEIQRLEQRYGVGEESEMRD